MYRAEFRGETIPGSEGSLVDSRRNGLKSPRAETEGACAASTEPSLGYLEVHGTS